MNIQIQDDYLTAGQAAAKPAQLRALSAHESAAVRRRVAENPNTPRDILAFLAFDCNAEVRTEVAFNKNTPAKILRMLAQDPNPDVRYAIAEVITVPKRVLGILAHDENPYVAYRAAVTMGILATLVDMVSTIA
jgi:hypothetical protein